MKLLTLPQVQELTGFSMSTIKRLEKNNDFPGCYKVSARAVRWLESDIFKWIEEKTQK